MTRRARILDGNMMSERSKNKWIRIGLALAIIIVLILIIDYLWKIFITDGSSLVVLRAILIAAGLLGLAHLILFVLRKSYERQLSEEYKVKKRRLEITRNVVNYITPFILLLILYHSWDQGWILTSIIVIVLLIDRVNDLLTKNK